MKNEVLYPLSSPQQAVWLDQILTPELPCYNIGVTVQLDGPLDLDRFESAIQHVVARRDALRLVMIQSDNGAQQRFLPQLNFSLRRFDFSMHADAQERAWAHMQRVFSTPFSLYGQLLWTMQWIQVGASSGFWMLCFHHLVADGLSVSLICNAVADAYNRLLHGSSIEPEDDEYSPYCRFITQDQQYLASPRYARDREFWLSRFSSLPEPLFPRTSISRRDQRYQQVVWHLERSVFTRLTETAASLGYSSTHFLLAILAILFARLTRDRDEIVIGMPLHNRSGVQQRRAVGMFSSLMPVGIRVDPRCSFAQILQNVAGELKRCYRHQRFPLAEINRCLQQGAPTQQGLFDVMFSMESFAGDLHFEGGIRSVATRLHSGYGLNTLAVAVENYEKRRDLPVEFSFDAGALSVSQVKALQQRIERLIAHALDAPDTPVCELSLLSEAERAQVLRSFNGTQREYPQQALIHELFEQQVERRPDAIAVELEGQQLSYAQLNARANQLARHLRLLGVGPDSLVGLCVERSLEMVIGILAALKAGGAYVPLDPGYPPERLQYMLEDSAPVVLLTQRKLRERLGACESSAVVVLDDGPWQQSAWGNARTRNLSGQLKLRSSNLAYVIYTSGSTGMPKGVMVEHRNVVNLIDWHCAAFDLHEACRSSAVAAIGFDAAVWEIFPPLSVGATLVLAPSRMVGDVDALLTWWAGQPLDVSFLPTPMAELAFSRNMSNPHLRTLLIGGDRLGGRPTSTAYSLVNNYGPTEVTVVATSGCIRNDDAVLHIGQPISNTQIYILDAHREPVPVGVAGEIYISGSGVARGYLNRAELTKERFLADPFSAEPGTRMYRTGDLGRWDEQGHIEFLGRNDHQVKIRGYRIELGEIEAQIMRVAGVRQAVVIAREDNPGEKRLVAYVAGHEPAAQIDATELRAGLREVLPEYMMPAAYVRLEQLPLTANGKVDRRALPAPEAESYVQRRYEAPVGEIEQTLAQIWSELLRVERVGREDSFFELGGHSLLAVQLISRLRQRLGIELPLQELFAHAGLSDLAHHVAHAVRSTLSAITPADRSEPLPLSYAQERLWFITQMDAQASVAYHMSGGLRLSGRLDDTALVRALDRIVQRHEVLRTRFVSMAGRAHQVIDSPGGFALVRQTIKAEELAEICSLEAHEPFDLTQGPPIRGRLLRLGEEEHVLLVTMHHIVTDGWSMSVLLDELSRLYQAYRQGEPDPLPPLSLQYADYAAWQRERTQDPMQQQQLQYWMEHLTGAPEQISLPGGRLRPEIQDYHGALLNVRVDSELTQALKVLSQRHGATLYMTMLAAWAAVVGRLSGQDQVVIGSPIANRHRAELEPLIGFFINTQALKVDLSDEPTVSALLAQVRTTALQAQANQDVPFEQVVEVLKPARSLSHSPIFQLMLAWQTTLPAFMDLRDLRLEVLGGTTQDSEKFDLTLSLSEAGDEIVGQLSYATALFDAATVQRYWGYLQAMLQEMVRDDSQCIHHIELLSRKERQQVLESFNATRCEYPQHALLHELFEQQVEQAPDAIAVELGRQQLSYAQLNARANQLAWHLRNLGVGPDSRVGLCVTRSLEMVIGILATLKAGGGYVPLDPKYPPERVFFMLKDSAPIALLTDRASRGVLKEHHSTLPMIDLSEDAALWSHHSDLNPPGCDLRPEHLAYVIYTSGSTGIPKGVMVEHRNAVNFISWAVRQFSAEQLSRSVFSTSINFDLAVFELFAPLAAGGTAVLVTNLISADESIRCPSLINTVPSAIDALLKTNAIPVTTRSINLAGEPLKRALVEGIFASTSVERIANLYGPSETTTYSTGVVMDKARGFASHIGGPIANTQIYILDAHRQPVPVGVVGEIYIGGAGVARGYMNRAELTKERFLADPFSAEPGARMYRTGDLARWDGQGHIEFLGRNDHQVKIRGYRIELGEIEAQLMRVPGVRQGAVIAREDTPGEKRLVAYVVCHESAVQLDAAELRACLREVLPDYMVPAAYVRLEQLPLTANGKLDRRALPAPEAEANVQRRYEAPVGEIEQTLAQIWIELLGVERVGRDDSFFEMGGHSLAVTRLVFMLNQQFGTSISIRQIHEQQLLNQMAQCVATLQASRTRQTLVLEL